MTGNRRAWFERRSRVVSDEAVFVHQLTIWLGRGVHPAVAMILAHEESTGSGQGNCWVSRSFVPSPTNQRTSAA